MRLTKAMKREIVAAIEATAGKSVKKLITSDCAFCELDDKYHPRNSCGFCKHHILMPLDCKSCFRYISPKANVNFEHFSNVERGRRAWAAAMKKHLLGVAAKLREKWNIKKGETK